MRLRFRPLLAFLPLLCASACTKTQTISAPEYARALKGEKIHGELVGPRDDVTVVLDNGQELEPRRHADYCMGDHDNAVLADCSDSRNQKSVALTKNGSVVEVKRSNTAANVVWIVTLGALAGASIATLASLSGDWGTGSHLP